MSSKRQTMAIWLRWDSQTKYKAAEQNNFRGHAGSYVLLHAIVCMILSPP